MIRMDKLKKILNDLMNKIKKENPNANWSNLLTGFAILVILAVFSVWYFGQNATTIDDKTGGETQETESGVKNGPSDTENSQKDVISAGAQEVTVQSSEGLWQVAERVCGDGEKYNIIAEQNGLTIWSVLSDGQTLKANCNE